MRGGIAFMLRLVILPALCSLPLCSLPLAKQSEVRGQKSEIEQGENVLSASVPRGGALLGPLAERPLPGTVPEMPRLSAQADLGRPAGMGAAADETEMLFPIVRLDVPGPQVLFLLESEEQLRERLRQEAKQRPGGLARGRLDFPSDYMVLSRDTYQPRLWPNQVEVVEPNYVGYCRLYFDQINGTRYGWDCGILAPVLSAGTFFLDFATLPLQFVLDPCRCYEYNTGYLLPGERVPFFLYPLRAK